MLPVVTEETRLTLERAKSADEDAWKKAMIHRLKEDNPEINTLLLELAQKSKDAKAVVIAGYLVYHALEMAHEAEDT